MSAPSLQMTFEGQSVFVRKTHLLYCPSLVRDTAKHQEVVNVRRPNVGKLGEGRQVATNPDIGFSRPDAMHVPCLATPDSVFPQPSLIWLD
jgi:hypothetical protein